MRRLALPVLLGVTLFLLVSSAQKKKRGEEEEEITQTREVPKDPPQAVIAETRRLVFHVAPLSSKGLLSQQVRDGLKALWRQARRASIVKLRAFVAGSGDMRRVQAIVSEEFSERRLALPALSVIQVGALPLDGAQVALESAAVARKDVNPNGLAFISGQAAGTDELTMKVAPLAEKSVAQLRTALKGAGTDSSGVLRVTCLLSSFEDIDAVRAIVAREFPRAALNYVQLQRAPTRSVVECEAVARLRAAPRHALDMVNPEGLPSSPAYSQVALVGAPRVALTGIQMAFGFTEADARLAFQRLAKALDSVGASPQQVAMSHIYPLSRSIADLARKIRGEFYDRDRPPASTMLPFEGLPSLDASFAVDVVAVLPSS